jgi:hypothetical protein
MSGGFSMTLLRRILIARFGSEISVAAVIQAVMVAVGMFTFFAGVLYMPSLAPNRVEMIMILLLLTAVALLCTAVGQLAVVAERLEGRREPRG